MMPAIIAIPVMAVAMALVAGVPWPQIGEIVTGGAVALAPVYVTVIFGALLAALRSAPASPRRSSHRRRVRRRSPLVVALMLCAAVALLFTSLTGLGAIIMVGSIVLPIMMTTGVPRVMAATLFLMAFALGFIFNLTNWRFYRSFSASYRPR